MTKILRNVCISLCGVFAFLFAGFFFVGCDVDYSKISLTSNVSSIELEVGESADVVFTIENYKKGFSNKVQVDPRSDETEAIFETSAIKYLSSDQIKVTIKAVAGGHGQLCVKTLEAEKECFVDVSIIQYSTTIASRNNLLYVSDESAFSPAANMFEFDTHTTYTALSHYLFSARYDFDVSSFKIEEIDEKNGVVIGTDSTGAEIEADIVRFDKASLELLDAEVGKQLMLSLGGEAVKVFDSLPNNFKMLSVYDYSIGNNAYEQILFAFSDVYILPSLNVQVLGGYLNETTNQIDFQPLKSERIVIVPNNSNKRQFILKLEMIDAVVDSEIAFIKKTSNNFVDVDLYDDVMAELEGESSAHYWKISQNSQTQNRTELSFEIYYKLAADVFDESVNVKLNYDIDIEIAPTAITVNGSSEPDSFQLYNEYENDRFGWQEMFVDVVSGFNSSPNYNGIYFTFDSTHIDVKYGDNEVVTSGNIRLYTDLSKSFYIRGKGDLAGRDYLNTNITIHLQSDILQDAEELSLLVGCVIIKGATEIQRAEGYSAVEKAKFVLDADGGQMPFNRQLYADQIFQDVTFKCQSVVSAVSLELDRETPYLEVGGRYYLNLYVTPVTTGDAIYIIYLDNGTNIQITFSVVKTLTPKSTAVYLLDSGNEAVSEYSYSKTEEALFNNILNLEILNHSTKDSITFGSSAYIGISANVSAGGVAYSSSDNRFISVSQTNSYYRLTTLENGNVLITFTLTGVIVDDFGTVDNELKIFVYASSYSLVEEFYLRNGSEYASENTVYYGTNAKTSDKTVILTAVANNENSSNFNQYFFTQESAVNMFENSIEGDSSYSYTLLGDEYYTQMQMENFDKKFVYFYALRTNGTAIAGGVITQVTITKTWLEDGKNETQQKVVELVAENGLMFLASDFKYEAKENDIVVATYDVHFSNIYNIGFYGTFDLESFTYINSDGNSSISFILEANISQRKLTRRYNAKITSQEFVSVDSISLASNLTELNLSSKKQTYSFGVYIYPTNATNKNINIQFVASSDYDHDIRLVDYTVIEGESGIYTITISCENFYKTYGDEIINFVDDLSGTLYIYPQDWGDSYTTIGGRGAIVIDVQYCNGSEKNPYVLETAEDVLEINSNEIMLKSHYKIATVIDMSTTNNATPIGILGDGENARLVGFSGSIVGTSSQASIVNIAVSNSNFSKVVDGVLYAGLFAQIGVDEAGDNDQTARIENLSFAGKIDLSISKLAEGGSNSVVCDNAFVSVLAAKNKGSLVNVGVTLASSNIISDSPLAYGGVTAENYGYILQDFTEYDGSKENGRFNGLSSKNLAYYNDFVTITIQNSDVFAGGIAGISYGIIERKTPANSLYKLYGYAAYSTYSKVKILGSATAENSVYVGGAVGKVSNEGTASKISGSKVDNKVLNLLVGGEVSSIGVVGDVQDAAGGIVGYANTNNVREVSILNNLSRCFVRGIHNVGGIAGFDTYSAKLGNQQNYFYVTWEKGNKIEAVDDGRPAYEASMILKATNENVFTDSTVGNTKETFFAIGNALGGTNGYIRNYANTGSVFSAISYVKRSLLAGVVTTNNASTNNYYGDYVVLNSDGTCLSYEFSKQDVSLGSIDGDFKMMSSDGTASDLNVFMLYYFAVQGKLSSDVEGIAQDEIQRLNYLTPNSVFYPFKLTSQEVSISTSSNELGVDVNGNITVKDVGLAYITLNSILNVKEEQKIYLYIVNYFDRTFDSSIFYTRPSIDGVNIKNNSIVNVYGNSNTTLYLVPSYVLDKVTITNDDGTQSEVSPQTADGESFSISKAGILNYKNVNYVLTKNTQLFAKVEAEGEINYSAVQSGKQTVLFFKGENADSFDGDCVGDYYLLSPSLTLTFNIGDYEYAFYYPISENASISVEVRYKDAAESINPMSTRIYMKTNEVYSDNIKVESTNADEVLFYEIFYVTEDGQELIQSRLPDEIGKYYIDSKNGVDTWTNYVNVITSEDLFNLNFIKTNNVFNYSCRIYDLSKRFLNRANESIYGEYRVYLYASELENGVSSMFRIFLSEAEVNYINVSNYSNKNDLSATDELVIPSQTGMLEIAIDPVEATFTTIKVSNNAANYADGATESSLMFVFEKNSNANESVEFISSQNFGRYENGELTFSYQDMVNYFDSLNDTLNRQNGVTSKTDENYFEYVQYKGKVYISYYMPSLNVDDGVRVGFDVSVIYGENDDEENYTIGLITKLASYAKLSFNDKTERDGVYYVARGLSYGLTLSTYGFSTDQVSISVSDNSLVSVTGSNGRYTLDVTSGIINYGGGDKPGREVEITTYAEKIVDNVVIPYTDTLNLYIMEYVMDYTYVEGVNEDIVAGMEDGTIYIAVGNPFELEFSIRDFLEYDSTNSMVNEEVEAFVDEMTQNIDWAVYYNRVKTTLGGSELIRTDYYQINKYTFTPLRIYNPETNIYRFSASANYTMLNGTYSYSSLSTGANKMYTEFVFDVHEQSTQDSPIPIENYEEFIDMKDNEWYILLKDITLPSSEYAASSGLEPFKPLSASIAGLDGNGSKLLMSGTYDFSDLTEVGVFTTVDEDTILQNIDVCVTSDTILKMNQESFDVGLLAATNNGVITNCEATSLFGASLSVVCSTVTSGAYVAGLVASNNGYITNSRSSLNLYSNTNVAGFVAQNNGLIASSTFRNASLRNQTNTTTEFTAGFVVSNSGRIYTSYVSGDTSEVEDEQVYYQGQQNSIVSSNNISGFVYSNTGSVEDCYSNIVLRQSGAFSAGFVFENSGQIERCFSTSTLENNQTSNYGFIRTNIINNTYGLVEDCYYLSDSSANGGQGVNVSIGTIAQDDRIGLKTLTLKNFGDLESFENYAICKGREISSVWFMPSVASDLSGFNGAIFDLNRPELVAPNIEATSVRQLDRTEEVVDEETGMSSVRYIYVYVAGQPSLGSVYNPILISDAESMEEYITRENNGAGYNYSYYRIINDIDYSEYQYNSKIYDTKFMGYIEGNFMQISGISLMSSSSLNYAGLFAEVGRSSLLSAVGTLLNFTVKTTSIAFANANVVGGVAGRLDGGTLINIRVEVDTQDSVVVSGNNIVGGVVGMALGNYKLQNVYSQVSAKARNLSVVEENNFDEVSLNFEVCSIAGSVVGVLSGTGTVYNVITDSTVSSLANTAGLMFGFIDQNVSVEKVELTVFSDMIVNAHTYAGLVVGETKGKLSRVTVSGDFDGYFTNFMNAPYYSSAVGGIAGLVSGGELSVIRMNQSIQISSQSDKDGVPYLGGIAGLVTAVSSFSDVVVNADMIGFSFVSGVIGGIAAANQQDNLQVSFKDISYSGLLIAQGHSLERIGIGGIAGSLGEGASFTLLSSGNKTNIFNVTADSTVYTYGESAMIGIGAVVGENLYKNTYYVANAKSSLVATIRVSEMSQTLESKTSSLKVVESEVEGQLGEVVSSAEITTASSDGENSSYYCDVTFINPNVDGNKELDLSYVLTVSNSGQADFSLKPTT